MIFYESTRRLLQTCFLSTSDSHYRLRGGRGGAHRTASRSLKKKVIWNIWWWCLGVNWVKFSLGYCIISSEQLNRWLCVNNWRLPHQFGRKNCGKERFLASSFRFAFKVSLRFDFSFSRFQRSGEKCLSNHEFPLFINWVKSRLSFVSRTLEMCARLIPLERRSVRTSREWKWYFRNASRRQRVHFIKAWLVVWWESRRLNVYWFWIKEKSDALKAHCWGWFLEWVALTKHFLSLSCHKFHFRVLLLDCMLCIFRFRNIFGKKAMRDFKQDDEEK